MASQSPSRACRILVVDDEPMIARGIKSMLERLGNPAVGEVHTAFSGSDAVARIESDPPDIVILDIRMPGMTGLDVLERCRTADGHPMFFVLSGHNEFEYVKRAFQLGALDYLLKPASMDELDGLIDTATSRSPGSWKESLADEVTARWSIQMALERALDVREATLIRDAIAASPDVAPHAWYRITIVRTPRAAPDDALTMRKAIGPQIWETSRAADARAFFFWTPDSDLGLLWNVKNRDTVDPMRRLWSTLPPGVREAPGSLLTVSAAAPPEAPIVELFEQASTLLLYRFEPDIPRIITASEARKTYGVPHPVDLSPALREAQTGNIEALVKAAEDVFAESPRTHGPALADAYSSLAGSLVEFCERIRVAGPSMRRIAELDTLRQVREEIGSAVRAVRAATGHVAGARDPVEYALDHVEAHLHEDLDMSQVASAVGMSYSHFSRLFKARTGEGFGQYVLGRRMRRARRMLEQPGMRVSEVAYAVGYRNHKHFSRAFREYFGQTPTQYRRGAE